MPKSSVYRGCTLFKPTMKWRAQISAGGKTTSLGDHDTEEEAARAFDRAAINKCGLDGAKTNFDINDYLDEAEELLSMTQTELVAMLRSRARKSGTQTSGYRGVSMLKQTGKWHAQINVGGKQVHLGFYEKEEQAAAAYDRAAINKGAKDGNKIVTNFNFNDYLAEIPMLYHLSQDELVSALGSESKRKQTKEMEMLAGGFGGRAAEIFASARTSDGSEAPYIAALRAKAERAQPKPTDKNPLYAHFGARRDGVPLTPEERTVAEQRRVLAAVAAVARAKARREKALARKAAEAAALANGMRREASPEPAQPRPADGHPASPYVRTRKPDQPPAAALPHRELFGKEEEESAEEEAAESDATTATDVASAHQSDSDSDADVVDERRRGGSADDAEMRFLQARPTPPYPKLRHVLHPGMAGRVKYDDFGIHMPATSKPRTKRQQALAEARARPASSRAVPLPTPPAPLTPAQPVRSRPVPVASPPPAGMLLGIAEAVGAVRRAEASAMAAAAGSAEPSPKPDPSPSADAAAVSDSEAAAGSESGTEEEAQGIKRAAAPPLSPGKALAGSTLNPNRRKRAKPMRAGL